MMFYDSPWWMCFGKFQITVTILGALSVSWMRCASIFAIASVNPVFTFSGFQSFVHLSSQLGSGHSPAQLPEPSILL